MQDLWKRGKDQHAGIRRQTERHNRQSRPPRLAASIRLVTDPKNPFVLKFPAMDRKTFLKGLALAGASLPCWSRAAETETGKCDGEKCRSDAATVRQFLSDFIANEDSTLDRDALRKLMEQRGRECCRALEFRQKLIADSNGSVDKLVELMGKIVGPANCRRDGDFVTLIYPVDHCVCGWSPARPVSPNDPYCDCSAANNRTLFETVRGKPVTVKVLESPRRTGKSCTFLIHLV